MLRACFLLALIGWVGAPHVAAQNRFDPPVIKSVKGYRFDQNTGKLNDTDVLSDDFEGSWNDTVSGAMLVVVELEGPPSRVYSGMLGPGSKYSLRLVATELKPAKQLVNKTRLLSVMSEQGRMFVSFLVEPTFCSVTRVVATIVGRGTTPSIERHARFACGE